MREVFEYRFEINEKDGLFACLARLRGNLFVTGFAVSDFNVVVEDDIDWIKPSKLLQMLNDPRFEQKR